MEQILKLEKTHIVKNPNDLIDFYIDVSENMGIKWDNVESIDPKKIKVSEKLLELWVTNENIAMFLVDKGPKMDENLKLNEVLISDTAIKKIN